ncbi:L-ascorbate oxidase-like isoform X3 [Leptopilina heterotoma]|uniref:L-ascorbate oxidase-like isoform X3 n=1 Tax=Leptopilina heterotoma TaxID=63436 RepID=UPI001CA810EB|nr:L-ascorbate oxidase-like isoform X3 [Leptopilina heterotoma]
MLLRLAIFVGLSSVVATIIYFTPVPEQTFLSCDRPCHHLDWPMICRVKLTLEVFQTLSKSCGECPHNETACLAKHCVSADGRKRGLFTANRQMPGPSIQVCENDILVVDVVNRLPGKAAVIHWRGQPQIETPCMDGAPLVTQCPIPSYTTFQYKFRASAPGTHLWHAHSGADVANGVFGSLIVRQAQLLEPHRDLYDIDDPNHVILLSQWQQPNVPESSSNGDVTEMDTILVNGKGRQPNGPEVPLTNFVVTPGRRHRFRVANGAGSGSCPMTLSVDGHPLVLIALDGHPVSAQKVNSITLAKGERADFILHANKQISTYWMNVKPSEDCRSKVSGGSAIVRYKGSSNDSPPNSLEGKNGDLNSESFMTTDPANTCENPEKICVTEVTSIRKMPMLLSNPYVDVKIYLPINYKIQGHEFSGSGNVETKVLNIDNATFTYPSSPLLTQGVDIQETMFCSGFGENEESNLLVSDNNRCQSSSLPRKLEDVTSSTCECVHLRKIPLGATVEIILLDQAGLEDLVYHLHGYSFYVVGARTFSKSITLEEVKKLDEQDSLFFRNLDHAPLKDTVIVPKFGAVAIRFKADNPGYWMLRDEHAPEWTRGLDVILQVGEQSDMVQAPEDFPKCGSFVGPDYFLI